MISEGTESNLPPKSCTWRGQCRVSYKEYRFNMISTWIARWSLEIKGSSSKLRLTRSMNSVVKWEIIASFSYDLYLDHRMALGDRGWYHKWPRDELNQLVRNISCLKIDEGVKDFISWADRGEAYARSSPGCLQLMKGLTRNKSVYFLHDLPPPFLSKRGSWLVSGIIPWVEHLHRLKLPCSRSAGAV